MASIVLVLDGLRSTHNVGSILRTADGFGVSRIYLCGITPYPTNSEDKRLPHLSEKITKQISKTALGAELNLNIHYHKHILEVIEKLKIEGYSIVALEQSRKSVKLIDFLPGTKTALVVGNEVTGVDSQVLSLANKIVEIPMIGRKESFNVAVSTAIALYDLMQKTK